MNKIKNIELSNPQFESGNMRYLTFFSPALLRRGDVSVFYPPEVKSLRGVPVVILLHGVYGSHWSWTHLGGAHLTSQKLIEVKKIEPLILLMPSDGLWGQGSAYIENNFENHEKWIVKDVLECSRKVFSEITDESPVFIAGLSMGGFGALRLGAKYNNLFKAISAHSSITKFEQMKRFIEIPLYEFGDKDIERRNPVYWLKKNREQLPALRFDCGKDDFLFDGNVKLHKQLNDLSIDHNFQAFEGTHSWMYWQEHLCDTLLFFNSVLKK
jgi:S-formylglutathione hydrolase FrmB